MHERERAKGTLWKGETLPPVFFCKDLILNELRRFVCKNVILNELLGGRFECHTSGISPA
jgi:hypothetical protein